MRNKSTFVCFGVKYRTTQYSAVEALRVFECMDTIHPTDALRHTDVLDGDQWHNLSEPSNINAFVKDLADALAPREVLFALSSAVMEFSLGFLSTWKGVRVPSRFQSESEPVSSSGLDPMIAHLYSNGISLKDLEEYYSLEDAFKMFDVSVAKSVNSAIATEAAQKAAQRR